MTDDEFIDGYGAETSHFDLLVLKENDPKRFKTLKRQYERTLSSTFAEI